MATGYFAAMAFWIYGIARPQVGYGSDTVGVVALVALGTLHLATGWLIGRWWAVLLPAVVVLMSIPAGTPTQGEEPFPIWFGLLWLVAPLGALLIAVATAIRRLALEPARR